MQWLNRIIVRIMPIFPKQLIWLFSKRYIAGIQQESAVAKTRDLNEINCLATMDVLGEDITSLDEAEAAKSECLTVLDAIHINQLQSGLSIKLTQLGLQIDKEVCYGHIQDIVKKAESLNIFVRIDMEDHTCTDVTLEMYRRIRKSHQHVGTVIQAYLKRSVDDVQSLIDEGIANLRLCKGIYDEPAEVAIKDRESIRNNFMTLIHMTLEAGEFAGIASHDKPILDRSEAFIREKNISKERYEFQMLLGVTERLRNQLVANGHAMRIYVPYGEQWYGYCMRRLKENPQMAGHVIKNLFIR
jgi:proline dehydrogenase